MKKEKARRNERKTGSKERTGSAKRRHTDVEEKDGEYSTLDRRDVMGREDTREKLRAKFTFKSLPPRISKKMGGREKAAKEAACLSAFAVGIRPGKEKRKSQGGEKTDLSVVGSIWSGVISKSARGAWSERTEFGGRCVRFGYAGDAHRQKGKQRYARTISQAE